MDKSTKKKMIIIIVTAYVLVIGLLIFVASSLQKKSASDTGLFKSDGQMMEDAQPDRQTEQERLEEYESREEMPEVTEETFYATVNQFLSSGNLKELDQTLRRWQETYKDSTSEDESKTAVIEQYRGDLAYYWGITASGEALDTWQFKLPDTLASCVAYTPIMQKYKAFINQESVMFPAMAEGSTITLSRSTKTSEELNAIRDGVNRTRTDENAFQQIAVYELTIKGYPCEFVAVMDRNTMTWSPYSLKVTNGMTDLPTVSICKEVMRSSPKSNLDVIIAIPDMISERPEGMTGNIDRSQENTPSSDSLKPVNLPASDSTEGRDETNPTTEVRSTPAGEDASGDGAVPDEGDVGPLPNEPAPTQP